MKSSGINLRTGYQGSRACPSGSGPTIRETSTEDGMAMHDEVLELLMIEEADAWFEYLEATRGQGEARYAEVEPWAWSRLRQRLRALRARRARLERQAA